MNVSHDFFATAAKGLESLLADELRTLGAREVRETRAGVYFTGDLALAYRVCLWSRLASRVLLPLARFPAATPEQLYEGVRAIRWDEHLGADDTLAVDFTTAQSHLAHTQYGAQKVKDAIVDQFRERHGRRPSVALTRPAVRINAHVHRDEAVLSLDLSGESLHRRGYRDHTVLAPMKETLAAAVLLRARWPETARAGGGLFDPLCGGGTLLIEGALMAADIAPGYLRDYFGFSGWRGHDARVWETLCAEAEESRARGMERIPPIAGCDADARAVRAAKENIARAGFARHITVERRELARCEKPARMRDTPGLLATNPPYGERLSETETLRPLYAQLGAALREHFTGWRAAVFTGNPDLGKNMGVRARKIYTLYNGALECKLLCFDVTPEWFVAERAAEDSTAPLTPGAEMFANRLRKNLKTMEQWARQHGASCYRLYDADLPEYAVAVDIYRNSALWAHVQEYAPPASVDERKARARLADALRVIPEVLEIPRERMFFKVRERQKGLAQYEALAARGEFHEVREGACRLLVNFTDYLDTGLFLDHRPVRELIEKLARGRRFLNLFAYTGTATVHAAHGGAIATTSVDMSRTYLDWARRNMTLNGFTGKNHDFIQADCTAWLAEQARDDRAPRYDLIFLDPPTFSNSKRMREHFDVQRDHVALIRHAAALLEPDGILLFSTNHRRFKLDTDALAGLAVEDISQAMLPRDFARNPRIHQVWRITQSSV